MNVVYYDVELTCSTVSSLQNGALIGGLGILHHTVTKPIYYENLGH